MGSPSSEGGSCHPNASAKADLPGGRNSNPGPNMVNGKQTSIDPFDCPIQDVSGFDSVGDIQRFRPAAGSIGDMLEVVQA